MWGAKTKIDLVNKPICRRNRVFAPDTFQVNDPFGEAVTEEARWRRTLEALRRVLRGEASVEDLLARRRAVHPGPEGVAGPPKVLATHFW